jgi:Arc/MetJ-type ribon-helix-helix transcriptional regulator
MAAQPHSSSSGELADNEHSVAELLSMIRRLAPEVRARLARVMDSNSPDAGRHLQAVGRARKVSVSMPEDLTAAVQERVGRGQFSQYVTEAVARQYERDLLGELSALLQAEHGPLTDEALAEARHSWPDTW